MLEHIGAYVNGFVVLLFCVWFCAAWFCLFVCDVVGKEGGKKADRNPDIVEVVALGEPAAKSVPRGLRPTARACHVDAGRAGKRWDCVFTLLCINVSCFGWQEQLQLAGGIWHLIFLFFGR